MDDNNALIMAKELDLYDFDERNLKACCCFHTEDTPSLIYNPKNYTFHCFGCQKTVDIIDVFMLKGSTYTEAIQKLFDLVGMKHSFGERKVKTKYQYKYPKEVSCADKTAVYDYLKLRKISPEIVDYADVRQDEHKNIVFNFYDSNDVLTMVKYRPSRKIDKESKEPKCWCQSGADTTPLLFNMNRVNSSNPLLICEGEIDCLSAIESGYLNSVSVPLGAGNFQWIEENWEWLEQFDSIIVCSDNDDPGVKMQKEIVYRLGSWRTKFVEIPLYITLENEKRRAVKDLNEILFWQGKDAVLSLILNAKESPVDSVADFSDIKNIDLNEIDGIRTGIKELDKSLMKLFYGSFNIVTGVNGCVDCDTEFFTGTQWKKISEYQSGDQVLQYNLDGTAKLVFPEAYIKKKCDYFWHLHSTYGVEQCVSDEHYLVYKTNKGHIQKKNVLDFLNQHQTTEHGFGGKFITTFQYDGGGVDFTDQEIRVICAVICDGHFPRKAGFDKLCRINLKKDRKKERLRKLLKEAGIDYLERHFNPKDKEYSTFTFYSPMETKSFGSDWYSCSQSQMQVIVDEILFWDGSCSKNRERFSSCDKDTVDFIQFAFSCCGKRSVVSFNDRVGQRYGKYKRKSIEYYVGITKSNSPSLVNTKEKITIPKIESKDGFKYCFTVESGMLVLRRNGRINITGNSGKSSFLSQLICESLDQGKNVFMYSGELPNFQCKNWINYIFSGQRNVKENQYNDTIYWKVTNEAQKKIDDYYKGRLFIYKDGYDHKVGSIMKSIEDTVRKYGVKLIIIDNLTSVNLESNENNKYNKQEEFVTTLIEFAKKFNVAVVLVVHPHKIETMRRLTKMDVQGISAIIDLAHRIISLYRVTQEDKKGKPKNNGKGCYKKPIKFDVLCDVLKDRMLGFEGSTVGMYYDRPSRRFFTNEQDLDHQYGWDKEIYNSALPFPPMQLQNQDSEVFGTLD